LIKNQLNIFLFIFFILIINFLTSNSIANEQDIKKIKISIDNNRDNLIVFFELKGCFTDEIDKAIRSGVATSFSVVSYLYQVRRFWPDKFISEINIKHTIKYDNLKKEYTVKRSWNKNDPFITQSYPEAQKLIAKIDNIKFIGLDKLKKDYRYQIRAKAKLCDVNLPFYHYFLFYRTTWEFETDWNTLDFIY